MKRGYSDYDVWDIDYWFLGIMPKMLKQLRDTTHSAPLLPNTTEETCHEEWKNILSRMIFLLGEMDEDNCSYENQYEEEYQNYLESRYSIKNYKKELDSEEDKKLFKKYIGEENNKFTYMELCKKEFFELFSKYFRNLWD